MTRACSVKKTTDGSHDIHCDSFGIIAAHSKEEALGTVYVSLEAIYPSNDGWQSVGFVHEVLKEELVKILNQL